MDHQRVLRTNCSFLDVQADLKVTYLLALLGSRHELGRDIHSGGNPESGGGRLLGAQ